MPSQVNQTELRISAMHLRLMDNVEQYQTLLQHLLRYAAESEQMASDVIGALEDGLANHKRAVSIENALSSRFIRIEHRKKANGPIHDTETEGLYQVIFGFDDGSEETVHFDKKQDQLLYILMVLCSLKNGLFANFFKKEEGDVREVVGRLIDLIWPNARTNGDYDNIITNLNPNVYFSDIVQKMKAPIEKCVKPHGGADELLWFLPFYHKIGLKCLYQMRMLPTNIHYPAEFQDIVDDLPDASKYADISLLMPNKPLKGFENIDNVQMHDVMLRKAEEGDVEAMNVVAGNYNWGTGVIKNQEKAFSWWKKAADLGLDEAQYYVGVFYGTGDIVPQDYKTAINYFSKAADQGYADAVYQLATFMRHGYGFRHKNLDKAIALYKRAAEMGHVEALKDMAWIYFRGEGVKKNYHKALEYYYKLAEFDYDEAYWHISESFMEGKGVPKKEAKGWEWIEKGIDKGFNRMYYLAASYLMNAKRYEDAYTALCAAEERGVNVYSNLALLNLRKLAGSKTREEALKWLQRGVEEGCRECYRIMRKEFHDEIDNHDSRTTGNGITNKRFILKTTMASMGSDNAREQFLNLVDVYRELFREDYIQEINIQLSIHRPSTEEGSDGDGHRQIIVRRTDSNTGGYEIVLKLFNGEETVVDSININSLMIYLLAIICSYKSGFNTSMAKSDACKPIIAQLYKMVVPNASNSEARCFIERFLDTDSKNNYYKTYSHRAVQAIKKALGTKDKHVYYLFENIKTMDRKNLRCMILDPEDIEIPSELMNLANRMPDAANITQQTDNQKDTNIILE